MKTHLTILLFVLIGTGSLWGAEYTATPGNFHNIQRGANSGDTILMEPGIYHGEWCDGPDGQKFWTPVIDPNGRNIVYKKDPNSTGEVILSGLKPPLDPPIPPDHLYFFRPPCRIINNETNDCQLIGLTIRCGLVPGELPFNPYGFFADFCDNYEWMGIECRNSSPLIQDCNMVDFPEYPAGSRGCKISITNTNGRLVIQSCRFIDINDGGVRIAGNADVQINSCTISGINTEFKGISTYPYSSGNVQINNCAISNCGYGGIDTGALNGTISDCNIINNHGSSGGGIACNNTGTLTVRRCNLTGNEATHGGAIYVNALQAIIEDCNITGNSAMLYCGGIFSDSDNLTLRRCRIENNSAAYGDGGGILSYGYLDANHCIIRENEAVGYGGGICAYDANLVNCVINENHAGENGGGIYLQRPQINSYLYNCTIRDNEANGLGGGAYFYEDLYGEGPINATNCIFWGNADIEDTPGYQRHHQIYSSYPDGVNLRNCDIQNTNVIGNYVFDDDIVYPDCDTIGKNIGVNIDANPLFADDYHLSLRSPCINVGYNNIVYWAYDIDGEQRIMPVNGIVDIGADEVGPPVSWWKLDDGSGNTAIDSIGSNNGTVYGGAAWTTGGQINGALTFDGTNDYVNCGSGPSNYDIITVSAWMKTSTNGTLVSNRSSSGSYGTWYTLFSNAIEIGDNSQGGYRYVYFNATTLNGAWHHIVYTKNGTNHAIYVDGALDQNFTSNADISWNQPTYIGRRCNSYGGWFNGKIDDVCIYDRALSAEQVGLLYNEGLSRKAFEPNPADGATGVVQNVVLTWSPGKDAVKHDVYFGIDSSEVTNADIYDPDVYMGNQDANHWDVNNYNSNGLDFNTTYYWRIDEIAASVVTKGDVWTFQVMAEPVLLNRWMFDEGTGNMAYDSVGTSNGTIYGATWTTGQIDGALSFDGTNDYVNCGSGPSNHDNITVSAWMRTSTQGALVSNRYSSASYGTWYTLFSNVIEIGDNSQGGYRYVYFNATTLNDTWHHIVYTKNGTNHAIYVDGSLYQQFTSNADISWNQPTYIGRRCNNYGGWFNGKIDDVRIYDRALSAAAVLQLYQSGL